MATAILHQLPGTITTILDMEQGQVAEILAILGPPECHYGMVPGIFPGMMVRCLGHDGEGTTLEAPDGELLRIPRDFAGCIQIERLEWGRPRRHGRMLF